MSNGAFTPTTFGDSMPNYGGTQQYYYANQGLSLTNAFASYGAVYKSQVWIATLVNKIAYSAARLPLKVYERGTEDARSEAVTRRSRSCCGTRTRGMTRSSSGCGPCRPTRSTARRCG
jgi:hypothetical protein